MDDVFFSSPLLDVFFRVGVVFLVTAGLMIGNGASISSAFFDRFGGDSFSSFSCCFELAGRFDGLEPRTVVRRRLSSVKVGVID